jgi:hypothetical protein
MAEDALDEVGLGEEGEDAQGAVATGAAQGVDLVDLREELGPADACEGGRASGAVTIVVGSWRGRGREGAEGFEFVVGPAEADDVGAQACVGRQDAVVAMAVGAGRRMGWVGA